MKLVDVDAFSARYGEMFGVKLVLQLFYFIRFLGHH